MRLRAFFSYYGGKSKIAHRYPAPEHRLLIEPFAGAAGYATFHHDRDVRLYDVNPIIVGVWSYLIRASRREILALPAEVETVDDIAAPQEARWLVGFWLTKGNAHPNRLPSAWMRAGRWPRSFWGEAIRSRIAAQVELIRHWRVRERSYDGVPDARATWFVDPPYAGAPGRHYRRCRPSTLDYLRLGSWVRSRSGQVIVCESEGADWLPFQPFMVARSTPGPRRMGHTREAVYLQSGDAGQVPLVLGAA